MQGSLPLQDFPAGELEEGDQGVEDPVGEPLLIVQGGRALYRAHRRVAAIFFYSSANSVRIQNTYRTRKKIYHGSTMVISGLKEWIVTYRG